VSIPTKYWLWMSGLFVLAFILSPLIAKSQTEVEPGSGINSALTLKAGFGLGGFMVGAEYGYPLLSGLVSGYYHFGTQPFYDLGGGGTTTSLHDVGILYGWTKVNEDVVITLSGGVGYLVFDGWKVSTSNSSHTVGIPIVGEFYTRSSNTVALGFSLYGNLNAYKSTGGITFCIRLG